MTSDLVDERDRLHQRAPHRGHDVADGDLLVPGREAHGDGQPGRRLGLGQVGRVEVVMAPGHGEQRHGRSVGGSGHECVRRSDPPEEVRPTGAE